MVVDADDSRAGGEWGIELAETIISPDHPSDHFKRWLLAECIEQVEGPETRESKGRQQPWWKIVCLTGVDYFSTLGYIPGIAAAFAVMLSALWKDDSLRATLAFGLVTLIFLYTNVANIIEWPDGIKIASFFIVAIIVVSLASRVRRSLELRQEHIELDEKAQRFVEDASQEDVIHIIAHRRRYSDDPEEYARKLEEQREYNRVPHDATVLFLEIDVEDPSEFEEDVLEVRGVNVAGHRVLRAESTVVPNAIAAFLLYLRHDRQDAQLLLRVDRGQPVCVRDSLHPLWGRRYSPGHPRGSAGSRA